jgi:hypothetical protein
MATMDRPLSLAALGRGMRYWWKRLATLHELDQCEGRDLQRILHDLNVSKAELTGAVIKGVRPEILLPQMLQELDLPADGIRASYPSVEADLRRVCVQCPETTRCRKELHDHTAAENYREFCSNSMTLEALQVEAANEARRSPQVRLPSVVKARWPQ